MAGDDSRGRKQGLVKSYNKKGFGFILSPGLGELYFSKDSIPAELHTSDLAGENVTFEVRRFPNGKMLAINLRPVGDVRQIAQGGRWSATENAPCWRPSGMSGCGAGGYGPIPGSYAPGSLGGSGGGSFGSGGFNAPPPAAKGSWGKGGCSSGGGAWNAPPPPSAERPSRFSDTPPPGMIPVATRSSSGGGSSAAAQQEPSLRRDEWRCRACGHINYCKALAAGYFFPRGRIECSRCGAQKPFEEDPYSGSRAVRGAIRPRSHSSSSSSSRSKKKRKRSKSKGKKKKKKKKKSSSSSSKSSSSSAKSDKGKEEDEPQLVADPDAPEGLEKAKAGALEKLLKLKEITEKDKRMVAWRALLREWHPDKNPDNVEIATSVFQFLQKGKQLLND